MATLWPVVAWVQCIRECGEPPAQPRRRHDLHHRHHRDHTVITVSGYRASTAPTRSLSTASSSIECEVKFDTVLMMMRVLVGKDGSVHDV